MTAQMTATLRGIHEPPPAAALARAALLQRNGRTQELGISLLEGSSPRRRTRFLGARGGHAARPPS